MKLLGSRWTRLRLVIRSYEMEKYFKNKWNIIGWYCFFSLFIICIKIYLNGFISNDLTLFFFPWYDQLKNEGVTRSFQSGFFVYSPLYLFLLKFTSYFDSWIGRTGAIKLIPNIFDFASAFVFSRILIRSGKSEFTGLMGYVSFLILPTVLFNSSVWGQCDVFFGFGMLLFLYGVLQKKSRLACIGFAIGFVFKFQMFFFSPVLLYTLLQRNISLKSLIWIPGIWIASVIPGLLAGASWKYVFGRLNNQLDYFHSLTMNAPNIYQWIPQQHYSVFFWPGILLAFLAILLIVLGFAWKNRNRITTFEELIAFTFLITLLVPLIAPRVHDRYFYLSDVAGLLYLFYFPKRIFLVVTTQTVSFLTYQPFLFSRELIPLKYLAIAYIFVAASLVKEHLLENQKT